MKFILVRHAHTLFNKIGLTQGWCDSPLTKQGYSETHELKDLLQDVRFDAIYSSPTPRAHTTASIISSNKDVEIQLDERLKEVNFGIYEGMPLGMRAQFNIEDDNWPYTFDMNYKPYEGEDIKDVIERQLELYNYCLNTYPDSSTIVLVGHGCSLYGLVRYLCGKQLDEKYPTLRFIKNSSAIILEANHDKCEVVEITDGIYK